MPHNDDPLDLFQAEVGGGLRPGTTAPFVMLRINGLMSAAFNLTTASARNLGMLLIAEAAIADRLAVAGEAWVERENGNAS